MQSIDIHVINNETSHQYGDILSLLLTISQKNVSFIINSGVL